MTCPSPSNPDPARAGSLFELFLTLPSLPITTTGAFDYEAADPQILVRLAENAEVTLRTMH